MLVYTRGIGVARRKLSISSPAWTLAPSQWSERGRPGDSAQRPKGSHRRAAYGKKQLKTKAATPTSTIT